MKFSIHSLLYLLLMSSALGQTGMLVSYADFESAFVDSRRVDIWLPPSYGANPQDSFPVIYMHDGQNLFEDSLCGFGVEWGVDETICKLTAEGKIPECMVVGIWNTPKRYPEYQPQKPYPLLDSAYRSQLTEIYGMEPASDNYLKFIVGELKPFVDEAYRTLSQREQTYIMGSSMGGLISLYAVCEYPDIFAGAGCLSTHWVTWVDLNNGEMARVMQEYLRTNLPEAGRHVFYFDYGTEELDAHYEKHQKAVDRILEEKGYTWQKDWISLKFEGASHSEIFWQERLFIPMEFLLGNRAPDE